MRDRPVLWSDGRHNDRAAIRHLLNGGMAYDVRTDTVIVAPTLQRLPPGLYRLAPSRPPSETSWPPLH